MSKRHPLAEYRDGILSGNRRYLSRAITLVESSLIQMQDLASQLVQRFCRRLANSIRIGITGVPGVAKARS